MKLRPSALLLPMLLLGSVAAAAATPRLQLSALAPGVHLVRPTDPADRERSNALVVEQATGLVVVNAQPTPEAAKEMLALVASKLGGRPVRALVLPHPHADAAGGASAFPPETLVIASDDAAASFADPAYDFGAEARARGGASYREPARPRVGLRLQGNATLDDKERPLELIPMMPGHSRGDLLVDLPAADLMAVGSLLFEDRNPWPGTANIGGWISELNNLASSGRAVFVPLHGAPADAQAVRRQRETLAWTRGQIDAAFVDLVPAEEIPGRVLGIAEAQSYFDLAARPSFARGVVDQALKEAQAQRRKFGLPEQAPPR
ncbi:MAG TPA: MBL fold metallo-hydrolase [Candidatus Polarisedimenticolaceae bacterium]|nr:MBL fold metallo-hydrolase [Candidatus Polarisedimenticolaceae bacterium]